MIHREGNEDDSPGSRHFVLTAYNIVSGLRPATHPRILDSSITETCSRLLRQTAVESDDLVNGKRYATLLASPSSWLA